MNITLLTIWYDERPGFLHDLIQSVAGICNHVVMVDGAYALYPLAMGKSRWEQVAEVTFAAHKYNLGLTLHQPSHPWAGNEVEKRNYALSLANVAAPDWLLVLDADERLAEAPADLFAKLEATDKQSVMVCHRFADGRPDGACKKLYRVPVRVGKWHAEYLNAENLVVSEDETSTLWLDDLVVEHRKSERIPERQEAAGRYYNLRDIEGIEPRA